MSEINKKPAARTRGKVLHEKWTLEELEHHIKAMMTRKEADVNESPDDVRRDLIEVLDQYPRHMAVDGDSRRYRQRMEALLSDDEVMGGPSPDHLKRSRDHDSERFWASVEYGILLIIIVIVVLAIVA